MKLKLYHTITIQPTEGYQIDEQPDVEIDEEGFMIITFFENIITNPMYEQEALNNLRNETNDELAEKDNEIEKLLMKITELKEKAKEIKPTVSDTDIQQGIFNKMNKLMLPDQVKKGTFGEDLKNELLAEEKTSIESSVTKPKIKKQLIKEGTYKHNEKICACGCGKKFIPTGRNQKYANDCPNLGKINKDADLKRQHKHRGKEEPIKESLPFDTLDCALCQDHDFCHTHNAKCPVDDYRYFRPKK